MLGSVIDTILRAYWERTVKQAACVPSSAIGSDLEIMPGSVLRLYSEVYYGAYSVCPSECLGRLVGSG